MNFKDGIHLGGAFAGRFVSAAGVLAITVLLSRQLPLAEAGAFFEAFTILMGLAILTRCGQELRLLRVVARCERGEEAHEELSASLAVIVLACAIIGLPILAWWGFSGPTSPLQLVWLPLLPTAVTNVAAAYAKGMGRPAVGALGEVGSISAVATILLLFFPPRSALEAWWALSFAAWIVGFAWYLIPLALGAVSVKLAAPRSAVLSEAKHLWFVSVLSYVAQWAVIVVVAIAMSDEAVAALNGLLRLIAPLQFVILTLDYFVAPRFAGGTTADIIRVRRWSIAVGLAIVLPYAGLLLGIPGQFLEFLYGPQYSAYGYELRILVVGTLFQMALGPNGMLLNMLSHDRANTLSVVLRIAAAFAVQSVLFVHPALWIAAASFSGALVAQSLFLKIMADRATKRFPV